MPVGLNCASSLVAPQEAVAGLIMRKAEAEGCRVWAVIHGSAFSDPIEVRAAAVYRRDVPRIVRY